jgi:predicted enzyme related to lactoylglutathione lyase
MAGKIVHFELPSSDVDRAASFWSGLFGWKLGGVMEGFDYRMVQVADDQGGAVFPDPDKAGTGTIVYFDTDDIETSIGKVRDLGGQAGEKAPVPGHGWFAACTDTEGNKFNLWQGDQSATMPA